MFIKYKGLKSGKSCGIDEISNEMLQLSVPVLLKHFLFLFNFILQNGTYPSNWKENVIKPIYKGGVLQIPAIIGALLYLVVLVNYSAEFFSTV